MQNGRVSQDGLGKLYEEAIVILLSKISIHHRFYPMYLVMYLF